MKKIKVDCQVLKKADDEIELVFPKGLFEADNKRFKDDWSWQAYFGYDGKIFLVKVIP